jgi:multiple sugar transport system permease protein
MFWENKLAMEVDNGGVAGIFKQQAPDLPFAAAPSPFPTRAQGLILAPLTVNANTQHKDASLTFVKWMLQAENQRALQDLLGASSVATVVERSPEDLAKFPWLKVYDDQTANSVPQLVAGYETKTPDIQQIVLEQVLKVPLALYLFLFQGYPLLQEFFLSFTSTSLLSPQEHVFVGLDNYRLLFETSDFQHVIAVTAVYTVACVVLAIGLGLVAALLLDRPFRGRGLARALVTIPWAAPPVAVALIFVWMFNAQYGIFNYIQRLAGLPWGNENWLDDPALALPAVLITTIWQIFPFSSVVILAALQGVSEEVREAAQMDGADRINVFKVAVWPTIRPTVALLALFVTIWSLRRFDLIWLMTQGGPIGSTDTLVIELYRRGFVSRELGEAAAVGMIGLSIAFIVTLVYFWMTRRAEQAEGRR